MKVQQLEEFATCEDFKFNDHVFLIIISAFDNSIMKIRTDLEEFRVLKRILNMLPSMPPETSLNKDVAGRLDVSMFPIMGLVR